MDADMAKQNPPQILVSGSFAQTDATLRRSRLPKSSEQAFPVYQ